MEIRSYENSRFQGGSLVWWNKTKQKQPRVEVSKIVLEYLQRLWDPSLLLEAEWLSSWGPWSFCRQRDHSWLVWPRPSDLSPDRQVSHDWEGGWPKSSALPLPPAWPSNKGLLSKVWDDVYVYQQWNAVWDLLMCHCRHTRTAFFFLKNIVVLLL